MAHITKAVLNLFSQIHVLVLSSFEAGIRSTDVIQMLQARTKPIQIDLAALSKNERDKEIIIDTLKSDAYTRKEVILYCNTSIQDGQAKVFQQEILTEVTNLIIRDKSITLTFQGAIGQSFGQLHTIAAVQQQHGAVAAAVDRHTFRREDRSDGGHVSPPRSRSKSPIPSNGAPQRLLPSVSAENGKDIKQEVVAFLHFQPAVTASRAAIKATLVKREEELKKQQEHAKLAMERLDALDKLETEIASAKAKHATLTSKHQATIASMLKLEQDYQAELEKNKAALSQAAAEITELKNKLQQKEADHQFATTEMKWISSEYKKHQDKQAEARDACMCATRELERTLKTMQAKYAEQQMQADTDASVCAVHLPEASTPLVAPAYANGANGLAAASSNAPAAKIGMFASVSSAVSTMTNHLLNIDPETLAKLKSEINKSNPELNKGLSDYLTKSTAENVRSFKQYYEDYCRLKSTNASPGDVGQKFKKMHCLYVACTNQQAQHQAPAAHPSSC